MAVVYDVGQSVDLTCYDLTFDTAISLSFQ